MSNIVPQSRRSAEQFAVGVDAREDNRVTFDFVDEHHVAAQVAIPVAFPISNKRVVALNGRQRLPGHKKVKQFLEVGFQARALDASGVILSELLGEIVIHFDLSAAKKSFLLA
ncbi:hypothetical protein M2103_002275 [Ereboglobus sp. PH5-5]|nr:hypothetical protein [Ereboglobus sp. PH5-5]MDF9834040.1 hypothetical protein [Ereboglobus sp. PH5-5]